MITISQALSDAGRLGGTSRSRRKAAAARRNGALGGRPRRVQMVTSGPHSIYTGSVLRILPTLPSNSFGGCLCDPPYELGFMKKTWDSSGSAFKVAVWREVYRVMVPGAYLLAFGGSRTFHRLTTIVEKAGFEIRDHIMWLHGQGFPKSKASLKPSYEPIVLARKPIGKVRPLAIDACRVGIDIIEQKRANRRNQDNGWHFKGTHNSGVKVGRWPANLIFDQDVAALLDSQARNVGGGFGTQNRSDGNGIYGKFSGATNGKLVGYGDDGGASRFFYCAKASQKERNAGLISTNPHTTVKPITLTQWLATLIRPAGKSRLLVPFCGSGSEMIGGIQAGWGEVVGIDVNNEYVQVAADRIRHWLGTS